MLTDLESTNGTRVNGEDTQLRILRFGDVIAAGRSVLLYGTREQIAARLAELKDDGLEITGELDPDKISRPLDPTAMDFELRWGASENLHSTLHIPSPPELPMGLGPGQAAQMSEILEYLHLQSRTLVQSVRLPEGTQHVKLDLVQWQQLLDLQSAARRIPPHDRRAGSGVTSMAWLWWLPTILLAAISLLIIVGNPVAAYFAARRGRHYSMGPFIGGAAGFAACWMCPWTAARSWSCVPLIADVTIPMAVCVLPVVFAMALWQSLFPKR